MEPNQGFWALILALERAPPSKMAEGVGFEPTLRFPVNTLSKRAPSATRPPLLIAPSQGPRLPTSKGAMHAFVHAPFVLFSQRQGRRCHPATRTVARQPRLVRRGNTAAGSQEAGHYSHGQTPYNTPRRWGIHIILYAYLCFFSDY